MFGRVGLTQLGVNVRLRRPLSKSDIVYLIYCSSSSSSIFNVFEFNVTNSPSANKIYYYATMTRGDNTVEKDVISFTYQCRDIA